jgi:lactoylglutathione lyase
MDPRPGRHRAIEAAAAGLLIRQAAEGERDSLQVKSLDHIHIYAAEPEESARFYQRHFEAKLLHRNTNANNDTRIFLALGGQILVLGGFPSGMAAVPPSEVGDGAYCHGFGVAHFGLRVAGVDAAVAELSASGVRILSQPVREPSGLSFAYIAAPDGVVVELTQYDSAD